MKLAQIQEAKYHRSLSIDNVKIAYQDAFEAAFQQEGNISMTRPIIGGPQDNRYVYVDISVYDVENQQDATHAVKRFVEKYKIPYNHLSNLIRRHHPIPTRIQFREIQQTDTWDVPYWRVTVVYKENK